MFDLIKLFMFVSQRFGRSREERALPVSVQADTGWASGRTHGLHAMDAIRQDACSWTAVHLQQLYLFQQQRRRCVSADHPAQRSTQASSGQFIQPACLFIETIFTSFYWHYALRIWSLNNVMSYKRRGSERLGSFHWKKMIENIESLDHIYN